MYNPEEKNIDLVREYFPSYHTKRFQDQAQPNLVVQENFVLVTSKHHNDLLTKLDVKVDHLRYGGSDDCRLVDVFYKEDTAKGPSPLLVYVHGGYWQELGIMSSCSIVGPLVDRGYRVAVMDYNKCPQVTLPQLLEEFTSFLLWVFEYAEKTETTRISFVGHSAGAHLIAQLLHVPDLISKERRQKVHVMLFICGVYDLRELWQLDPVNPNNIFGLNSESVRDVSPMLWSWLADSASWPGLNSHVLSAQNESATFIEQSRAFAKNLKEAGFEVSFKLFDKYDHFDIIEETFDDNSRITKFLIEALF
ncbi:kynurenine formamidase [Drosophila innubila]|uniref:kynurenine formamidase n=1 Tax=Drosophila innubila TaxID=198719 RepID=UPI00148E6788|nr:kynurenine formamidase [Drosophila innubila]XP_034473050.1 kynurenine formamidase [Drosophila innubila]